MVSGGVLVAGMVSASAADPAGPGPVQLTVTTAGTSGPLEYTYDPAAVVAPPVITSPTEGGGNGNAVVEAIISDTFGKHDAIPRGVPAGYSWYADADTDANKSYMAFKQYGAINTWGQVFVPAGGSDNYDVRVQMRDSRVYFLADGIWTRVQINNGPMGGAYWSGNFNPSGSQNASIRSDGDGMYSVPMSPTRTRSDVFHWWWDGQNPRIPIPSHIDGILLRTDIRLVPDTGRSNVDGAKFIACSSADLFATPSTIIGPNGMNDGTPEPRMKWVTGEWQHFYSTTLSTVALKSNPPEITD